MPSLSWTSIFDYRFGRGIFELILFTSVSFFFYFWMEFLSILFPLSLNFFAISYVWRRESFLSILRSRDGFGWKKFEFIAKRGMEVKFLRIKARRIPDSFLPFLERDPRGIKYTARCTVINFMHVG